MNISKKNLLALALAATMVTGCGGGGDDDDDNNPGTGDVGLSDLDKAKAFVDDLRNLQLLFTQDLANEQGTGSAQVFIESFEAVAEALGDKDYNQALDAIIDTAAFYVDSIGDGLGDVNTSQFAEAYNGYLVHEGKSNPGLGNITGTISYDTTQNIVRIDATIGDIDADLTLDVTDDGDDVTYADATLTGTLTSISTPSDMITFNPGSTFYLELSTGHQVSFLETVDDDEIEAIGLALDATIDTVHNGEAASFTGALNYDLVKASEALANIEPIPAVPANVGVSGSITMGNQVFETAFNGDFNNAESFSFANDGEEGSDLNNWMDVDFELTFKTLFNGDDVDITWTAARTDFNQATTTLSFAFGSGTTIVAQGDGERTEIVADGDDVFTSTLTITHNLGAEAVLDLDNEKFDIMVNGNDMGDIVELGDDSVKATFSDGNFEIL